MNKCYICQKETDIVCENCKKYVCEDCLDDYNAHWIPYNKCKNCEKSIGEIYSDIWLVDEVWK